MDDSSGFVYVMVKESADGLVKLGRTERKPHLRASELDSTDSPTPSIVAYYAYCDNHGTVELRAHAQLGYCRIRQNREWFRCSVSDAIEAIKTALTQEDSELFREFHNPDIDGGPSSFVPDQQEDDDHTPKFSVVEEVENLICTHPNNSDHLKRYKGYYDARIEELRGRHDATEQDFDIALNMYKSVEHPVVAAYESSVRSMLERCRAYLGDTEMREVEQLVARIQRGELSLQDFRSRMTGEGLRVRKEASDLLRRLR